MLRAASVDLAKRSDALTSIARTGRSLRALDAKIMGRDFRHRMVPLDYNRLSELRSAISEAIDSEGPADLLVAWVHDDRGPVPVALCELVLCAERPCRLVHVMGSAAADPTRSLEETAERLSTFAGIAYQPVILGFHADGEGGQSRWLTNAEIAAGVLEAIDGEASPFVVGQVEPWALRP